MFEIEKHTKTDKKFSITGDDIFLEADYDDCNHEEVDAAADALVEVLNKHRDEFENIFKAKAIEYQTKRYNEQKDELVDDYPTLEDYLKRYL